LNNCLNYNNHRISVLRFDFEYPGLSKRRRWLWDIVNGVEIE